MWENAKLLLLNIVFAEIIIGFRVLYFVSRMLGLSFRLLFITLVYIRTYTITSLCIISIVTFILRRICIEWTAVIDDSSRFSSLPFARAAIIEKAQMYVDQLLVYVHLGLLL